MLVKRSMFCVPSYFLCFSVFAMVKYSIRLRVEKTGNPVFLNLVPLLVGNVGPIFTKGDLKEVDEEVAKYKVGAPARTGLVAHIDAIAPPGNTGLNLAHTRASIKPISPTFSRVSIKVTLHHRQPPTLSIAPPTHFHAHLSRILEFPCKQNPMHVAINSTQPARYRNSVTAALSAMHVANSPPDGQV